MKLIVTCMMLSIIGILILRALKRNDWSCFKSVKDYCIRFTMYDYVWALPLKISWSSFDKFEGYSSFTIHFLCYELRFEKWNKNLGD